MGIVNVALQKPLTARLRKSAQVIEGRSGRKNTRFLMLLPEMMTMTPSDLVTDFYSEMTTLAKICDSNSFRCRIGRAVVKEKTQGVQQICAVKELRKRLEGNSILGGANSGFG